MKKFKAHRAVCLHSVVHALVLAMHIGREAGAAAVAVQVVVAAANTADAAPCAVELALVLVVVQSAHLAKVLAKHHFALWVDAAAANGLLGVALAALDGGHRMAVHVFGRAAALLVVAQAAGEEGVAAGRLFPM